MARRTTQIRRRTDRVEDWTAWVLLAAGLLVIIFGCAFGIRVDDQLTARSRAEALDRTPASATLLKAAPTIASAYATGSPVGVTATWEDRFGVSHTGIVDAPQGLDAGSSVPIWVDRSGAEVSAPTTAGDAFVVSAIAAGLLIAACLGVLALLWEVVRRVILAVNCAAWEREWRTVAPIWRGEGKRG